MSIRDKVVSLSGKREYKTATIDTLGEVRVRSLTEQEYQSGLQNWFRDENYKIRPERQKYDRVKSIQMCVVNADDTLTFSDSTEDLDLLVNLGSFVIDQLVTLANQVLRGPTKN